MRSVGTRTAWPTWQSTQVAERAAANFRTNAYCQLSAYTSRNDALWQCSSAVEDKPLTMPGNHSPLLGYMGNMFTIGVSASPWSPGSQLKTTATALAGMWRHSP